ncbi:uncharacterized protein DDB_G0281025 [Scaptodrosophila lebanonensis]|uniref:Uncharacterized protein DDB_G0281025 n=1 Tax=Drosophila lebanonensis TaxID=7225 RepID=A0A6J2UCC5_DROLE|nr:uncharacterized protein DDB_G0281025 [Scaptodrosophila lebanonensis]
MAFSRHNIEKRRLIELVRLNPILWDCRLPHYKRSDKKKAIKWNELGRIFNVNGERVQRTFTSLREIFRRELNHEKMLGPSRFKSKWEYYDAMLFLKQVIRERKSRERIKQSTDVSGHIMNNNNSNNNNNNNSVAHDEYQYFAPSDPNNPNNQSQTAKLNLSDSPLNISQLPVALQQQAQHLHALQLQPDITLTTLQKQATPTSVASAAVSATITPVGSATTATVAIASAVPVQPSPPQVLSSSHSCSSSPSIYIKDEPDTQTTSLSTPNGKTHTKLATIRPQTKQQLKARLQLPKGNEGGAYATPPPHLIINSNNELIDADAGDLDDDDELEYDDDDEDEDGTGPPLVDVDLMGRGGRMSPGSSYTAVGPARHTPSARELLHTKFGDFLAARLNTLHETVANELMNKILLLIAEK